MMSKNNEEGPNPVNLILINFLEGFTPVDEFGPGVAIMTTNELLQELSDMADISQEELNAALFTLGFSLGRNNAASFGWLMKRIIR